MWMCTACPGNRCILVAALRVIKHIGTRLDPADDGHAAGLSQQKRCTWLKVFHFISECLHWAGLCFSLCHLLPPEQADELWRWGLADWSGAAPIWAGWHQRPGSPCHRVHSADQPAHTQHNGDMFCFLLKCLVMNILLRWTSWEVWWTDIYLVWDVVPVEIEWLHPVTLREDEGCQVVARSTGK